MAEVTLSPCPFCEGDAEFIDGDQKQQYGNEQVGCTRCMALTAPEPTKQAAAQRWNSRGNHPELDYVAAIESDINELRERLNP